MGTAALLLALGAATLHAVWNLLLRGTRDTEAATAVSVVTFVLVLAPLAVFTWDVDATRGSTSSPPARSSSCMSRSWRLRIGTSTCRSSIRSREGSPRSRRSCSPWSSSARTRQRVSSAAFSLWRPVSCSSAARAARGAALGCVIAATIGGYTLIDRYGIQHADAFSYALLIMLGAAIAYPPFVGYRRVRAALSPTTVLVGILSAAAYVLVLLALRRAPAPSVSAVRETGVVIAAVLAAVFLRERVGPARFAGAVLVAAGIALLALG